MRAEIIILIVAAVGIPPVLAILFWYRWRSVLPAFDFGVPDLGGLGGASAWSFGKRPDSLLSRTIWLAILAVLAGLATFAFIKYGEALIPSTEAKTSQISLSTYDGTYAVGPGVGTRFPAERISMITVSAPREATVGSTYEVKLLVVHEGAKQLGFAKGTYTAALDGPSHTSYRAIPPCEVAGKDDKKDDKVTAPGKAACVRLESAKDELGFRWLVEAAEVGRFTHNLSLKNLQPFPAMTASSRAASDIGSARKSNRDSAPKAGGFVVDENEPWSFILSRDDRTVRISTLQRNVKLDDLEADLAAETLYFPVQILTKLGISSFAQEWLQVAGAILAALLTGGLGAFLFKRGGQPAAEGR